MSGATRSHRAARFGVQVEFTVDSILDGGPSKADIRRFMRAAIERHKEALGHGRFESLRDIGIKYLHEASSASPSPTESK